MDRHRQPPTGTGCIGIADEFDKGERQKQRCEKVKGAVLVAGDEIVRTRLLPRQFKANFIVSCNFLNQFRLKHLQPAAQPADDTAAHRVRCPLIQTVRCFGRMCQWQNVKQAVQLTFAALGDEVVHLANIPLLRRVCEINIQNQCFQQVHLAGIPETVALAGAVGVFDDNVYEKLRHQLLSLDFFQAVPRV